MGPTGLGQQVPGTFVPALYLFEPNFQKLSQGCYTQDLGDTQLLLVVMEPGTISSDVLYSHPQ